ncbi:MAG TPA: L,D-transpeptidase [Longimicrobium sp.]|nr:L,D-transpeptidase [Longimicrobium sp.]
MFSIKRVVPAFVLAIAGVESAAAQTAMELVVNIPSGRLDVFQNGERIKSYPVSVGTARHTTPTHDGAIRRLVWNPTWTPPPDAAWARDEKPAGPGWGNPMGRVKLHLFSDIYVHGTPRGNERRLGNPASHGCIRMKNEDVMELAQLVMAAEGGAGVSDASLQRLIRTPGATREVALSGRVRARVIYRLTEVNGDSVSLLPDVYGRARANYADRVRMELAAAGAGTAPVLARLASVTRAPASRMSIPRSEFALPERDAPVVTVDLAAPGAVTASTATAQAPTVTAGGMVALQR